MEGSPGPRWRSLLNYRLLASICGLYRPRPCSPKNQGEETKKSPWPRVRSGAFFFRYNAKKPLEGVHGPDPAGTGIGTEAAGDALLVIRDIFVTSLRPEG